MTSITYYISLLGTLYITTTLMLFVSARLLQQPKLAFYARLLVSYLCLLLAAAYGVVVSILLRLVGYGQVSQWATARCFKWLMWYGSGVMFVVVEGEEHLRTRPAVFVGNHQT